MKYILLNRPGPLSQSRRVVIEAIRKELFYQVGVNIIIVSILIDEIDIFINSLQISQDKQMDDICWNAEEHTSILHCGGIAKGFCFRHLICVCIL